ncbi:hypothetical protein ACFSCZ_00165 [Siminovitchia sediminis]|uniref:Uncharacterized protein n=1 Tax=Siminovitchia sediminis TaxID=1274353 RepID=A0ABW4KFM3_9BACI
MNGQQNGLLNRNKDKEKDSASQSRFQEAFRELEKETTNDALATQFPDWDLKPPGNLVKRRRTSLL